MVKASIHYRNAGLSSAHLNTYRIFVRPGNSNRRAFVATVDRDAPFDISSFGETSSFNTENIK